MARPNNILLSNRQPIGKVKAAQQLDVAELFRQGFTLLQMGQIAQARFFFQHVLAKNPRHFEALYLSGVIEYQARNLSLAVELFEKATTINSNYAQAFYNCGIALLELKRAQEAEVCFDKAIGLWPDDAEAYSNRGIALTYLKRFEEALTCFDQAIALKPDYAKAYNNRGIALTHLKRFEEAITCLDKALVLKPDYFEAHSNRGNAQKGLERFEEAIESYEKAIALNPKFAEAYCNRGAVLHELNRSDDALSSYDRAIALMPDYAEAHNNRGNALKVLKRLDEAIASFDRAIEIRPEYAEAYSNKGAALQGLKRLDEALISYNKAIALVPDFAEAYSNRGNALKELMRTDEAIANYDRAIALKPDYAEAYCNRGSALQELKRMDEALASYAMAIQINPSHALSWSNQGNALAKLDKYEEAIASYEKAINIKPECAEAWDGRGTTLVGTCRYDSGIASIREALRIDPDNLVTHSNLLFSLNYGSSQNPIDTLKEAKIFGEKISSKAKIKYEKWPIRLNSQPLRIGLVSGDLRGHSVGFFVEGLIKNLDSEKFEIHAFSTSPHADELTSRIRPCFRDWMPIHGISDEKAAALIHEKEIDILIDLAGHTAGNRIPVFAYKPAPLQISWLGLPMTTGAAEMDYVIGDAHALPHDHEDQFVESIWRLPDTYLSMDLAYLKSEVNRARRTPNDQITFGSFNNISKINDAVMKAWSEILNRVPSSRLYLKCKQLGSPEVQRETVNRFLAHGVQPDRLLLSAQLGSRPKHLEEYRKVDIALDTFPYPGVTTSAEALWMGVPVLSMKGNSFLSSTATSIAVNAGLIEWVAKDVDEYVAKAVAFASDSSGLSAVCDKLRATIDQSVLFDSPLFAERFGNALMSMWNQRFGA